ncbi:MAG: replication protein, partial [Armatimonadetes bacterium]|nr:replication protein [Armatimonadota bacterium]
MSRVLIPNSTQIPDVILDDWMARLSGSEFKVLMYVARRTYGFGKREDAISLKQIMEGIQKRDGSWLDHGTGLSKQAVVNALKSLEEQGLIVRIQHLSASSGEYAENTYEINLQREEEAPEGVVQKLDYPGVKNRQGVVQKLDYPSLKNRQGVVQKLDTQETEQETEVQETQQQPGTNTVQDVNHPSIAPNPPPQAVVVALTDALTETGITRQVAEELIRKYPPESLRRQMEWLPQRKAEDPAAVLVAAITEDWAPPPAVLKT